MVNAMSAFSRKMAAIRSFALVAMRFYVITAGKISRNRCTITSTARGAGHHLVLSQFRAVNAHSTMSPTRERTCKLTQLKRKPWQKFGLSTLNCRKKTSRLNSPKKFRIPQAGTIIIGCVTFGTRRKLYHVSMIISTIFPQY